MNTNDLLKKLVQIESYSGHETNLGKFIVDWANEITACLLEKQNGNIVIKFLNHSAKSTHL